MKEQLSLITIESLYDEFGSDYCMARINKGLLVNDYIERPVLLRLIQEVQVRKKSEIKKVLDIGCGPGIYTKDLAGLGKSVTAIDISGEMLAIAKNHCERNLSSTENINFHHTSFENFNIKNENYDLILATFMLSYFNDLDVYFRKISNNLSSKGKVITSMLHPIRLFAKDDQSDAGYNVTDYFQNGYYDSDFMDKNSLIPLKRWTFQNISEAAFDNGLLIEKIIEPIPSENVPNELVEKANFYRRNPSVVMFVLRKMS
jgi:ubiquinone/menaquinone biosynthesis C-methylase UbiE